jgi:hypothetical protein
MTDVDPGPIAVMKEIAIFEFTVKCLALLDSVGKTKKRFRLRDSASPSPRSSPFARPRFRSAIG